MFERLVTGVRGLLQRRRAHRELDEELAFHVEMETRANVEKGFSPAEARRKALVDLGGVDQTKEAVRDQRATLFDRLAQDLRYALRRMRREPGSAAVAVVTIGLAVGLTTAIYSVAYAVLLRPLPYKDPNRLVAVWQSMQNFDHAPMTAPQIVELRARDADFVGLAGVERDWYTLIAPGISEWCETFLVTSNLFDVLGVQPIVGRTFLATDDRPGSEKVIVLSERYWRRVFGADPGVVGRLVRLAGQESSGSASDAYEVIGVVPSSVQLFYRFPTLRPDVYAPLVLRDADSELAAKGFRLLFTFGRLRPGVTVRQADGNVRAMMATLERQHPSVVFLKWPTRVVALRDELLGQARPTLLLLGAGVALVLLIACVNVAGLLLAGGARRGRELTIRLAIGCSRRRLLGQLLTEHLLLAAFSGLLGVVLAALATPMVARLAPSSLPRADQVGMNLGVLGFALGISLVSGLAFGAAPAWALARTRLLATRVGPLAVVPGTRRLRGGFVIAETALVVVLLAAAGLVAGSLWQLAHLPLGFDPEHVVVMNVGVPKQWADADHARRLDRVWLDTARGLPGVTAAALGDDVPFSWGALNTVELEGTDVVVPSSITAVDLDYLPLLQVPLREGRMFGPRDAGDQEVAIVNEALARRLVPAGRALGRRVKIGDTWREIVGIVGNVTEVGRIRATYIKQGGLSRLTLPAAYVPLGTRYAYNPFLLARTSLGTRAVVKAASEALRALDPELAIGQSGTLEARVEEAGASTRFQALLMSLFAAVALVLAAVGIYGVLAHMVGQRTREIGIRMALGARPAQVRWMVSAQAAALAGAGAAIGLAGALAGSRIIKSLLFEVSPTDPTTLAAAVGLLLLVAALATWLPARRATQVDPATTLRSE